MALSAPRKESAVTDAIVTTPAGLITALKHGAAHIEIQEHLDFTQHGEVLGASGKNDTVLVLPYTVKSIRGNCAAAMPSMKSLGLEGEPLKRPLPGQCLLAFAGRPQGEEESLWALSASSDQANTLWLDHLYLRAGVAGGDRRPGRAHLLGARRKNGSTDKIRAGPSVYMTKMTFQGTRLSPVVAVAASTRVYIADSQFADLGDHTSLQSSPTSPSTVPKVLQDSRSPIMLSVGQTTAVLRSCDFRNMRANNAAVISHSGGVAGIQLKGCVFENNHVTQNLATWAGGIFFSDSPQKVLLMEQNTTTDSRPLSELPSHEEFSFLSIEDNDDSLFWLVQELKMPSMGAHMPPAEPPTPPSLMSSATSVATGGHHNVTSLIAGWAAVLACIALIAWRCIMLERKQQRQFLLVKSNSMDV